MTNTVIKLFIFVVTFSSCEHDAAGIVRLKNAIADSLELNRKEIFTREFEIEYKIKDSLFPLLISKDSNLSEDLIDIAVKIEQNKDKMHGRGKQLLLQQNKLIRQFDSLTNEEQRH